MRASLAPPAILRVWIQNLPKNFLVAEVDGKVAGFIFFEYLNKIKAIPFVHNLEHNPSGRYVYISEVGVLDEFTDSEVL